MRVNRAWLGLVVLMLPTLLVAMDMTALLLALPRLSAGLGATNVQQLWISDSYGFMVAGLVITIKCGRLNTQMPAFDKFAYSDGRCYGKKQADLKVYPNRMPDPPATLQQREIDLIADFMMAKVVGKGPMNRAKCVEFWGTETDVCKAFPN